MLMFVLARPTWTGVSGRSWPSRAGPAEGSGAARGSWGGRLSSPVPSIQLSLQVSPNTKLNFSIGASSCVHDNIVCSFLIRILKGRLRHPIHSLTPADIERAVGGAVQLHPPSARLHCYASVITLTVLILIAVSVILTHILTRMYLHDLMTYGRKSS